MGLIPGVGGSDKYGWVLPVGLLAGGGLVLNKLGILKFERDATTEVKTDPAKLSYDATFFKNNADELYNNLNAYWTNAGNVLRVLKLMKTPDDIRQLYKEFGHKANTSNLGILNINVGQGKDLKQWLLDYHTNVFDNDFITKYFAGAGL